MCYYYYYFTYIQLLSINTLRKSPSPCCSQISPVRGVTSSLCSGVPRFVAPLHLASFLLSLQFPTLSLLATLTFLRSAGVLCPVPLLGLSDVFLLSRRVVGPGEDNHGRRQRDSPLPMGPLSPGQEGVCQCFPCRVTRSCSPSSHLHLGGRSPCAAHG